MAAKSSAQVGRPRVKPAPTTDLTVREQILDAAAALFIEHGFTATTTRAIADLVGPRQASLYYHFSGKEEMLEHLLRASLDPYFDIVQHFEHQVEAGASPAAALHALATTDARLLSSSERNVSYLWLLPEVQNDQYRHFLDEARRYQDAYARLGAAAASAEVRAGLDEEQLGVLLEHLTELVPQLRRTGRVAEDYIRIIADSCLRICGLSDAEIADAATEARGLIAGLPEASGP